MWQAALPERMKNMKPMPTYYKGYSFRSRLEARWAVFFDACGVKWEYMPEEFYLGFGMLFRPTFLLHGLEGRVKGDLYVFVSAGMTLEEAMQIRCFVAQGLEQDPETPDIFHLRNRVLIVGSLPEGPTADDAVEDVSRRGYDDVRLIPNEFNFESVDGDYYPAHPGINKDGRFELFGDDFSYLEDMDKEATGRAYMIARNAWVIEDPGYVGSVARA